MHRWSIGHSRNKQGAQATSFLTSLNRPPKGAVVRQSVGPNTATGPAPFEFRLETITSRGVELAAGGKRYKLQLARAQLGADDELIHHHRDRAVESPSGAALTPRVMPGNTDNP